MKLLLVSGGIHDFVRSRATKRIDIVNREEAFDLDGAGRYLDSGKPTVEAVLISEEAFSVSEASGVGQLESLLGLFNRQYKSSIPILVLTRDFRMEHELGDLLVRNSNLRVHTYDTVRATAKSIDEALEELRGIVRSKAPKHAEPHHEVDVSPKRRSLLDRFRPKPKPVEMQEAVDALSRQIESVSRGISRIVAITGHRGSGVTSTVVNLACEADKRGLSAIIVDMDVDFRSLNMYFGGYHETAKQDDEMSASLIRTLARPQDYKTTAYHVKDRLWIAGLGYDFADRKLIEQFYISNKVIGMLSMLRTQFNLVLLDFPLDVLRRFQEVLIHVDRFGLCVPNNLHAVLSTIRAAECSLTKENNAYLNAKSKVVVTKYNDRSRLHQEIFSPDRVSEILSSGLSESFAYDPGIAGYVPYTEEFDAQIETDVPLVRSSAEHERAYANILLRLLEGSH